MPTTTACVPAIAKVDAKTVAITLAVAVVKPVVKSIVHALAIKAAKIPAEGQQPTTGSDFNSYFLVAIGAPIKHNDAPCRQNDTLKPLTL